MKKKIFNSPIFVSQELSQLYFNEYLLSAVVQTMPWVLDSTGIHSQQILQSRCKGRVRTREGMRNEDKI